MNSDPLSLMEAKYVEGYLPDLFSWDELAYLINIRPLLTTKRVKLLDEKGRQFKWMSTGWNLDPNCYPPALIKELLEEMVRYFTDMSRSTEKINDVARSIENTYQRNTDAHIYVCRNPSLEHPFGAHFDDAHNIIVQCEGQTHFKVWKEVKVKNFDEWAKSNKNLNLDIKEDPILDVVMNPGDVLWVPMYYPHHAVSLTPRLSVSFPFTPRGLLTQANEDRNWITL